MKAGRWRNSIAGSLGLAALVASLEAAIPVAATAATPPKTVMTDSEWQRNSGGGAPPERYQILRGDTLWGLSKRFFGDGQSWPKLYEWNKDTVSNPDLIYTGKWLIFVPGTGTSLPQLTDQGKRKKAHAEGGSEDDSADAESSDEVTAAGSEAPQDASGEEVTASEASEESGDEVAANEANDEGDAGDEEEAVGRKHRKSLTLDSVHTGAAKSRSREWKHLPKQTWEFVPASLPSNVDAQGFDRDNTGVRRNLGRGMELPALAETEKLAPVGTIIGARSGATFLNLGDTVYIRAESDIRVGGTYAVTNEPEELRSTKSERVGFSYPIYGKILIKALRDDLFVGTVVAGSGFIARGSMLIENPAKVRSLNPIPAEAPVEGLVMMDHTSSTSLSAQGRIIFIDRGSTDGVKPGNVFRMYEHYDMATEKKLTSSDFIIDGDAIVIQASEHFCEALVIRSVVPINEEALAVLLTDVSDIGHSNEIMPAAPGAPTSAGKPEEPPAENLDNQNPAPEPAPVESPPPAEGAPVDGEGAPPPPVGDATATPPANPKSQKRTKDEGDDLDKLDDGSGLGTDEQKELKQLEKWKNNPPGGEAPPPPPTEAKPDDMAPPPPPPVPEPAPAKNAKSGGEPPPPPPPPSDSAAPPPAPGAGGNQAPVDESKALDQLLNQ